FAEPARRTSAPARTDIPGRPSGGIGDLLEDLYLALNHRRFVHPDPLEFLYLYPEPGDREIVALLASCLAYGRVAQILSSVRAVLDVLGPSPRDYLAAVEPASLRRELSAFRHRFTTGQELASVLLGAAGVIARFGSLGECLKLSLTSCNAESRTLLPALESMVGSILGHAGLSCSYLLPRPSMGSACKRLNLMLRWMIRRDEVDPGGWEFASPGMLVVPLDTHMFRAGRLLGFTCRSSADMRCALDITEGFRSLSPEDPVRYDFALTRLGIRPDGPRLEDLERAIREAGLRTQASS
ncbi:TIGR02757 family protein, partial [Candidatus Fermentibacterales bacterium]|nr:TIGR02757 family protein [Candidatus Fermentibacterales bacterium]